MSRPRNRIRADALHKLTTTLVARFKTIVIEDLNVRGMVAKRRLARAISDVGLFEFRRQLTYKAKMELHRRRGRSLVCVIKDLLWLCDQEPSVIAL